jgi:hypothetical protein
MLSGSPLLVERRAMRSYAHACTWRLLEPDTSLVQLGIAGRDERSLSSTSRTLPRTADHHPCLSGW